MLRKIQVNPWIIKVPLSVFSVLATFLLVGFTVCNAQGPQNCLNQFTGTGKISKGFIYTPVMGNSPILGHFVMIPDAMSPQEGKNVVGKTLGVIIGTNTLINGKPIKQVKSLKLDKLFVLGKRVLVNFQAAPETQPSTSDTKFSGTAASLTLIDPTQLTETGKISKGFFGTPVKRSSILGHFVMIPDTGNYAGEALGVQIDKSTPINGKPAQSQHLDKILGSGKKVSVKLKAAPELLTPSCSYTVDSKLVGTAASLTLN
jgi:hypothetical protein